MFGCVECDIHVPDHFQEMCRIFRNIGISRDNKGEFMKTYTEENDIMRQPRRSLIRRMVGKKILLATPLLKWYLEHGLQVRFKI